MEVSGRFIFISIFCLGCMGPILLGFSGGSWPGVLWSQSLSSQRERRGLALGRSLRVSRQGRKQLGTELSTLPIGRVPSLSILRLFVIYFLVWYWGWYPPQSHALQLLFILGQGLTKLTWFPLNSRHSPDRLCTGDSSASGMTGLAP